MSYLFSRDSLSASLKRGTRTRTRKPKYTTEAMSLHGHPLQVIHEVSEDVGSPSRPSFHSTPPRTPSPTKLSAHDLEKALRRQSAISALSFSSSRFEKEDAEDIFTTSRPPRAAPRPPTYERCTASPTPSDNTDHSVPSSADSFTMSFDFPLPPTSPSPSGGSVSSPESRSGGLPVTPTSSDDESSPRRPLGFAMPVPIKPLVIAKQKGLLAHAASPSITHVSPENEECGIQLERGWVGEEPAQAGWETQVPEQEDEEDDAEFYAEALSATLSLSSPLPPAFPPSTRPESVFLAPPPSPPLSRRKSRPGPLPIIAEAAISSPSTVLDPAFHSATQQIKKQQRRTRPPPRMSIPADALLDDFPISPSTPSTAPRSTSVYSEDLPFEFTLSTGSPTSSAFPVDAAEESPFPAQFDFASLSDSPETESFPPATSAFSADLDDKFDVDLDLPLHLPVSMPSSPVEIGVSPVEFSYPLETHHEEGAAIPETPVHMMYSHRSILPAPASAPAPAPAPAAVPEEDEEEQAQDEPDHQLRSRWSSSTLSSIATREQPRSPTFKLRSYFGSSASSSASPSTSRFAAAAKAKQQARVNKARADMKQRIVRVPPVHPAAFGTRAAAPVSPIPPVPPLPASPALSRRSGGDEWERRELRRRASQSSNSSYGGGGSESGDSASSSGSGLKRKPIPIELFIKR